MKVVYTGYTTFKSFKKDPNGIDFLVIGIVWADPRWHGYRAENKFIPYSFLPTVERLAPESEIIIEEFNNQIISLTPVKT